MYSEIHTNINIKQLHLCNIQYTCIHIKNKYMHMYLGENFRKMTKNKNLKPNFMS